MHPATSDINRHLIKKLGHFITTPSEDSGEHPHADSLKSTSDIVEDKITKPLLSSILRPRPQRPFCGSCAHSHEAAFLQHFGDLQDRIKFRPSLSGRLENFIIPPLKSWTPRNSPIVAHKRRMILLKLHPPTRSQVLPNVIDQLRPIPDSDCDSARVDVVEFLVVDPGCGDVVDDELHVGRHCCWLDGREVDSYHARIGMRFCELDRPCAGATTYVEDVAEGVWKRTKVEALEEASLPDAVL